ncbi:unnamed protein product, partial [Symbiodinium sp. KB8]
MTGAERFPAPVIEKMFISERGVYLDFHVDPISLESGMLWGFMAELTDLEEGEEYKPFPTHLEPLVNGSEFVSMKQYDPRGLPDFHFLSDWNNEEREDVSVEYFPLFGNPHEIQVSFNSPYHLHSTVEGAEPKIRLMYRGVVVADASLFGINEQALQSMMSNSVLSGDVSTWQVEQESEGAWTTFQVHGQIAPGFELNDLYFDVSDSAYGYVGIHIQEEPWKSAREVFDFDGTNFRGYLRHLMFSEMDIRVRLGAIYYDFSAQARMHDLP